MILFGYAVSETLISLFLVYFIYQELWSKK